MTPSRTRQLYFGSAVMALSIVGLVLFFWAHQPRVWRVMDWVGLSLFTVLFVHLSIGVVSATIGFFIIVKRPVGGTPPLVPPASKPRPRIALIMPIYHEEPRRVFAGMRRMIESLNRSGRTKEFDSYVLSDSQEPNAWIEEEKYWLAVRRELGATGRIFYRRRKRPIHQKSGNVADFCRRWGKHYRYMIVLDADSIMTAEALLTLVDRMERDPYLGIIQTLPRQVLGQTTFARIQQFGSWLYSPMYAAGASYWQGNSSPYWGHNAIIRVAPFIEYCGLPEVPRIGPLRGRFLSHDSVEAAFMRRLGYGVRVDYDLEGSYEEGPPDLATALKRDRRWCRGNLQHLTLLSSRGLRWENKVLFLIGVMAYGSALLWLLIIIYAVATKSNGWGDPRANVALLALVGAALLMPKFLGMIRAFRTPSAMSRGNLILSILGEFLSSVMLAPIQMISHSGALLAALRQKPVRWSGLDRQSEAGSWMASVKSFAFPTVVGFVGLGLAWMLNPLVLPWLLPVAGPLCFSIPFTHYLSKRRSPTQQAGNSLFTIPEEVAPPQELEGLDSQPEDHDPGLFSNPSHGQHRGILQVIVDPYLSAAHILLLGLSSDRGEKTSVTENVLALGPESLTPEKVREILNDPDAIVTLHRQLWSSEGREVAAWWMVWFSRYNDRAGLNPKMGTVLPGTALET